MCGIQPSHIAPSSHVAAFAVWLAHVVLVFTLFTLGAQRIVGKGSGCKSTNRTFETFCLAKLSICGAGNAVRVWYYTSGDTGGMWNIKQENEKIKKRVHRNGKCKFCFSVLRGEIFGSHHGKQNGCCVFVWYHPVGQLLHSGSPATFWYLPEVQSLQPATPWLFVNTRFPAGHVAQDRSPGFETVPSAQALQSASSS